MSVNGSSNGKRTIPGLGMVKGLGVTISAMFKTIFLPHQHLATVN